MYSKNKLDKKEENEKCEQKYMSTSSSTEIKTDALEWVKLQFLTNLEKSLL